MRTPLDIVPFLAVLVPVGWMFHDHLNAGTIAIGVIILVLVALSGELAEWFRLGRHRRRLDQLQAFADGLPCGLLDGRGFYQEGRARVRGNYRDQPIQLVIALHETRPVIVYQVRVEHPVARFDLIEPGLPARLTRCRPRLRGRGPSGSELQLEELDQATRFVLCGLGLENVRLGEDGQVTATKGLHAADLEPARLRAVFDALTRVAALCGRRRIAVRVLGGLSFVYTGGGGIRCPYCHDGLDAQQEDLSACSRCRTVHHQDCFREAGGCTLLGCEGLTTTRHTSPNPQKSLVA